MSRSVEIVSPLQVPEWNAKVLRHESCSIFHSREWSQVLADTYRYEPVYAVIASGDSLQAVFPVMDVRSIVTGRRGVSLPFTDVCPVFVEQEGDAALLWQRVQELGCRCGWEYVELRGRHDVDQAACPSREFLAHHIELADNEEEQFARLKGSVRRAVRKAWDMRVSASCGNSEGDVLTFCALNDRTRRRHGLPPQPRRFFQNLHRLILARGMGFICTATYANRAVASAVFLAFGRHALFKYGASDARMQHLRANNLVMWEGIRRCIAMGIKALSLGRTHPDNEGLRQFKRGWGTEETSVPYFRYDLRRNCFTGGGTSPVGWYNKVLVHLPLFLLKGIGAALYRHMG